MNGRVVNTVIKPTDDVSRLDYWLAKRFNYHTRSEWQRLIKDGTITVNGQQSKPSKSLMTGDTIDYDIADTVEPAVDTSFTVLHEDSDLLIINKSGNLPCHPSGRFFKHSLWYQLKQNYDKFWIINRLDRETSGIVVIAKKAAVARDLCQQFASQNVGKKYLVLVEGDGPDYINAKGYLTDDTTSAVRKKLTFIRDETCTQKSIVIDYRKLEQSGSLCFYEAIPKTGKLHQIRATLCSLGLPLVGDKIYGLDDQFYLRFIENELSDHDLTRLRAPRQALHAYKLTYYHPILKKRCTISASLPVDFSNLLQRLNFEFKPYCS